MDIFPKSMKTAVHETKSKFLIPFLILIKVHKHKQTGIPLSFWFLSFTLACLSAKANTNINRHLCSFLFDYSLSSFKQMQTQISRYFSFLLYPSLPVTNKYK